MTGMGSSTGATVFYCVALSMVAAVAAPQLPPTESDSVAAAEFASSALKADTLPSRKLMGVGEAPLTGMCPVRFDQMTGHAAELGRKCKTAPVKECCDAFKAFACPHHKLLNDVNNGCADDMFYFIQTHGHLPQGTIFKKCLEGPHGLKC